jgi:hypothetical protein
MRPDGALPLNLLVDPVAFERALLGDSLCERVWKFGRGFGEPRSQSDLKKIETEPKIRKVVSGSHQAKDTEVRIEP